MIGAVASVTLAFLINLKWKISAHMIGIGGLTGALVCMTLLLETNMISFIVFAIIASGITATSRLTLNAHTPHQLVAGYLLGISCQVIAIYL